MGRITLSEEYEHEKKDCGYFIGTYYINDEVKAFEHIIKMASIINNIYHEKYDEITDEQKQWFGGLPDELKHHVFITRTFAVLKTNMTENIIELQNLFNEQNEKINTERDEVMIAQLIQCNRNITNVINKIQSIIDFIDEN